MRNAACAAVAAVSLAAGAGGDTMVLSNGQRFDVRLLRIEGDQAVVLRDGEEKSLPLASIVRLDIERGAAPAPAAPPAGASSAAVVTAPPGGVAALSASEINRNPHLYAGKRVVVRAAVTQAVKSSFRTRPDFAILEGVLRCHLREGQYPAARAALNRVVWLEGNVVGRGPHATTRTFGVAAPTAEQEMSDCILLPYGF